MSEEVPHMAAATGLSIQQVEPEWLRIMERAALDNPELIRAIVQRELDKMGFKGRGLYDEYVASCFDGTFPAYLRSLQAQADSKQQQERDKMALLDTTQPFQSEGTNRGNAMGIEAAQRAFNELKAAGVPANQLTIRQRSWDEKGIYFAVEVQETGSSPVSLYNPTKVQEFIKARKPLDIQPFVTRPLSSYAAPTPYGKLYQFRVQIGGGPVAPGTGSTFNSAPILAPDGSQWWSEADIRSVGGVATHSNGKRYRLGRMEFVPFVS